MKKKIKMTNLTCSGCIRKITDALLDSEYIDDASYNLVNEEMVVFYNQEIDFMKEEKRVRKLVNSFEDGVVTYFEGNIYQNESSFIKKYWVLMLGALVFSLGYYYDEIYAIIAGYILFVSKISLKGIKSMVTKISFDENMLMFVATIAAMYIGEYIEAMAVVLFYTVGEFFQSKAVAKSKNDIKSLIDLKVEQASCYKGGILMQVNPSEIKVNDRILIKPGERVPVDCVVATGSSTIDMSSLTGESVPVDVNEETKILSGSINLSSPIEAIALKEYSDSMISKVIKMVEESTMNKAETEEFITKFAKYYTPIVTILAILIFAIPTISDPVNHKEYLYPAAVFLVISCPCALVLSVPLTYFAGIGRSAKEGVLFKGSNHLATMAEIDTVFLDKTGTITHGNFAVSNYTSQETLRLAASIEQYSNHPIAQAIAKAYQGELLEVSGVKEIAGYGVTGEVDSNVLLVGNARLMVNNEIEFQAENASDTVVYVAYNGKFEGVVKIADEIKETSAHAIQALSKMNIKTTMLTGDNDRIAAKVASEVGGIDYKANLLPQNKGDFISSNNENITSLFVGDGINDSVALVKSDIGVTMGQKGSDLALEVSDVVILNDDLSLLPKTINIAKFTKKIVFQNITGSLAVKVLFLILGAFSLSAMWMAIIADVGVSVVAVLNSIRILSKEV